MVLEIPVHDTDPFLWAFGASARRQWYGACGRMETLTSWAQEQTEGYEVEIMPSFKNTPQWPKDLLWGLTHKGSITSQ
jgi:hypothetical protein